MNSTEINKTTLQINIDFKFCGFFFTYKELGSLQKNC